MLVRFKDELENSFFLILDVEKSSIRQENLLLSMFTDWINVSCLVMSVRQFLYMKNKGVFMKLFQFPLLSVIVFVSSRPTACTIRTRTLLKCARSCARCTTTARPSRQDLKLVSSYFYASLK